MYIIGHQMSFLHPALLLRCQLAKHLSKVLAQLEIQRPSPTFRYEDHVIFAVPCRVIQTLILVHPDSSFRLLGGSRLEVSAMDNP